MLKPDSIIRQISVGSDYKNAMVYRRGQKTMNNQYEICLIDQDKDSGNIVIYIKDEANSVLLWKEFSGSMPVSIEFYVEYEKPI